MKSHLMLCLVASTVLFGCLDDDEVDALAAFRTMRAEMSRRTREFIDAAVQGDSLTLQRLGSDSALADIRRTFVYDSSLLPEAQEEMVTWRFELGACAAQLLLRKGRGDDRVDAIVRFQYEESGWKIARFLLPVIVD